MMRVVGVLLLLAASAGAYVPAKVRHEMQGRVWALPAEVRVALSVRCTFYEDAPWCSGTLTCRPPAFDGRPRDCPSATGKASFEVGPVYPSVPNDPAKAVRGGLSFDDGTTCTLEGRVPFVFGLEIPAISGHATCTDPSGRPIGDATFGFRTVRTGTPWTFR